MYSSIIAENRGIWLLKFLEQLCAGVNTVKTELENISGTVTKIWEGGKNSNEKATLEQAIANLEETVAQLTFLLAIPGSTGEIIEALNKQILLANNYCSVLKIKLKDYEKSLEIIEENLEESEDE
jgi:ABC-type transporter Mla subunit MlaD